MVPVAGGDFACRCGLGRGRREGDAEEGEESKESECDGEMHVV